MSNQSTEIAGIEQAPAPCFYPEDENGHAFEWGDGTPHWTTASEAHRMMFTIRRDDRGVEIRLRRETEPCWHVTCDECGYRYDEDEWLCHFLDRKDAEAAATDSDWHFVADRLLCSECYLSLPPGHDGHAARLNGLLADCPGCAEVTTPPGQAAVR